MDISSPLESENLFSYVQVRSLFDLFADPLGKNLNNPTATEVVLNLCRLSAAELALLPRSFLPTPIETQRSIEISPREALSALAKTDTSLFFRCRAAEVLPTREKAKLSVSDFVLFTGDGDKIAQYWEKHDIKLVENVPYEEMLKDLESRYQQANLTKLPFPLSLLNVWGNKILRMQLLLLRAKLDICIGTEDGAIRQHIEHSKTFLS